MKKIFSIVLMSGTLLMACSAETPVEDKSTNEGADTEEVVVAEDVLVDGTYSLEELEFGETGWKEALQIVVEDSEIVDATWTSVNEDGVNKIDDENYQETMMNTDGVGPQDFIPALEEALVDAQNVDDIDVVSGATGTSEKFKEYAQLLINAALEGNTELITVDNTAIEIDEEDIETEADAEESLEDEPVLIIESVDEVEETEEDGDTGNFGAAN